MAALSPFAEMLGWLPTAISSASAANLNSANTRHAMGLVASADEALVRVRLYCSGTTGSPAASDIQCDLCSDANGRPGSVLESKVLASLAVGWCEWTGWTTVLAANAQYWVVVRNLNGTPASNYATFAWIPNVLPRLGVATTLPAFGWNRCASSDGGSSWGTVSAGAAGLIVDTASGVCGVPFAVVGSGGTTLFGANTEAGVRLTTSLHAPIRVAGLGFSIAKNGTPATDLHFRLHHAGATYDTDPIGVSAVSGSGTNVVLWLAEIVEIAPGSDIRITAVRPANGDGAANRYEVRRFSPLPSGAQACLPFGGMTWTHWDGAAWNDDATLTTPAGLVLDNAQPFGEVAGGTTVRRVMLCE